MNLFIFEYMYIISGYIFKGEGNMVLTDAQKRANKKWHKNNRERANYIAMRSSARSFIRNKSTTDDLEELEYIISQRKKQLNNDSL